MSKSRHLSPPEIESVRFFLLTFVLSWMIWVPLVLSHYNIGSLRISDSLSNVIRLLGVMMPMVAALILTRIYGRRSAIRHLLSRLKIWRVSRKWWASVILVYPLMILSAGIIYILFDNHPKIEVLPLTAPEILANILFLSIASLGEEIGWRGFALPSLLHRYSPLTASTILGLLWATWHIPFWLLLDILNEYGSFYFVLNYIFIVPSTFYITWFFISSCQSLLLPVMFHLIFNIINVAIFPVTSTTGSFTVFVGLQLVLMYFVISSFQKNHDKQMGANSIGT